MIFAAKKLVDSLTSNVQSEEEEEVYAIYPEDVDLSGVPRKFIDMGHGDGLYLFPKDDVELLKWCRTTSGWNCVDRFNRTGVDRFNRTGVDRFNRPKIHEVKVEADNCTVEGCLELLKEIGRENRFIACSVESASLFFAKLNKEDADKLKGLDGIHEVSQRRKLIHM